MENIVVSGDVLYLLPIIIGGLVYLLTTDKWPLWANALLAGVSLLVTAIILILLDPGFIANNPKASIMLTIAYIVYLMKGPAKPLVDWLKQANMQNKPIIVDSIPVGSDQPSASLVTKQPTAIVMPKSSSTQQ